MSVSDSLSDFIVVFIQVIHTLVIRIVNSLINYIANQLRIGHVFQSYIQQNSPLTGVVEFQRLKKKKKNRTASTSFVCTMGGRHLQNVLQGNIDVSLPILDISTLCYIALL